MNEERLDPQSILKQVQEEERQLKLGKLKIYLGAAPGVGKTYSMLEDANQIRKDGLDVVIGVVESHGRSDIESLLNDLEIIPKQVIDYRGIKLTEFDLDAALKRNPGLILIDEMAHSNVEGTRHAKRWQDIKELLDRGIDVYTTLNVQHIESLNNNVSEIIHAPIKETVPDSMLELADTIELIDLPPEELLKRLHEGKVYFPKQAEIAKDKFFRKGNLIALRELALRVTAARVGEQVLLYRKGLGIKRVWSSHEKILVCVCAGDECLELIRAARRLASSLQASWLAIYVDSPRAEPNDDVRNKAIKNLRMAEQLGAETTVITGTDIVKEVMSYARDQNVTLIMVWKHIAPRWKDFWKSHLADDIVRNSGEINVYIITGTAASETVKHRVSVKEKLPRLRSYFLTFAMIFFVTLINFLLLKLGYASNVILTYIVGVVFIALIGNVGNSLLAVILSTISYNWFFSVQKFELPFSNFVYFFILLLAIVLAKIISNLTALNKIQTESVRNSERKATALHRLSRKLASTRGVMKLLETGAEYIAEFFDAEVMVLMPENDQLIVKLTTNTQKLLDSKELGVAQWVYGLGQIAGIGTDTLPESDALYVPLLASKRTMGVFRICPNHPEKLLTPEQIHFLESCVHQIALSIEVDLLQEQKNNTEFEREIEHTRSVLLQSVSQDLRSPLAKIMLTATSQIQLAPKLTPDRVQLFAQTIYKESEQLSRLVNNLLQITYLENNAIKLNRELSSLQETINNVITASREKLEHTPVEVHIPVEIPLVPFDKVLIEGVFINLLDNALKFAPNDQSIEIFAELENTRVIVSFEDHGPGIYGDERSKLFEKFYKGRMLTSTRGLGLGLAICRIIIEAHNGQIWAENRDGGGAAFKFSLPLD